MGSPSFSDSAGAYTSMLRTRWPLISIGGSKSIAKGASDQSATSVMSTFNDRVPSATKLASVLIELPFSPVPSGSLATVVPVSVSKPATRTLSRVGVGLSAAENAPLARRRARRVAITEIRGGFLMGVSCSFADDVKMIRRDDARPHPGERKSSGR